MAGIAPLQLCHTLELELQKIAGCLYDNIEVGRNTYKAAEAIERHTRTDLTEILQGMSVRPNDPDCSTVNVTVKYRKPECDVKSLTCDEVNFTCETAVSQSEEYESCQVTMNECVADQFSVSADAFNCDCTSTVNQEVAIKLANSVRRGYAQYSKILGEKIVAGAGKSYDGEDFLKLKLFCEDLKGKLELQPQGTYAIKQEYMKQSPNCAENPVIITGSEKVAAYDYMASNGVYNGTNTPGANARPLPNNIYFDPAIASALGSTPTGCDGAVSFLPGSVSLLEWFCFDNPNFAATPGGRVAWAPQFVGTRIVKQKVDVGTSVLGVPFVVDLMIIYDECAGKAGTVTYKWKSILIYSRFQRARSVMARSGTSAIYGRLHVSHILVAIYVRLVTKS